MVEQSRSQMRETQSVVACVEMSEFKIWVGSSRLLWACHWYLNLSYWAPQRVGEKEAWAQQRRFLWAHWLPVDVNKQVLRYGRFLQTWFYQITKCRLHSWTSKRRKESSPPCHSIPKSSCTRRSAYWQRISISWTCLVLEFLPLSSTRAAATTIGQGRDQDLSRSSSKLRECSCRASGVTCFFPNWKKCLILFQYSHLDPIRPWLFVPEIETAIEHF